MKMKIISALFACSMLAGVSSAATIGVTVIANNTGTIGNITAGASATLLTGTAYIYVTTTELGAADFASFSAGTTALAKTNFEALLAAPTPLRTASFTNGVIASTGNLSLNPGEKSYVFFDATTYYGIYQGANVPSSGAVTINPSNNLEDLKGTSAVQSFSGTTSGFQLVAVPEPSAALLGMLGALGLLRRRR